MTSSTLHGRPVLTLDDLEAHDPRAALGGRERRFLCPLASCAGQQRGERHRSLALNVESGLWTCHRCRAAGRLREHWTAGPGRGRARALARAAFRIAAPRRSVVATGGRVGPDAQGLYAAAAGLVGTAGASYLAGRAVPTDLAEGCGVRFAMDFFGRPAVLFPLRDRSGCLAAVHGRYVDGRTHPKARTAGPKSQGMFSTPGVLEGGQVAICEAPIDALSLSACGVPSIALCGTSGPSWLAAVCAFRDVLVALDADEAGDRDAAALLRELRAFGARARRCRPDGAKDWNELLMLGGIEGVRVALHQGASQ